MSESTNRNSTKAMRTKNKIIDSFLALNRAKTWDKISVKELCQVADITRGTFYQYFSDIYDLMEQLETGLLEELISMYEQLPPTVAEHYPIQKFESCFDYSAPKELLCWFEFCKKHQKEMSVLLDPQKGDVYFSQKLRTTLRKYVENMMDSDHMPHDSLRSHFVKLLIEVHLMVAHAWVDTDPDVSLSIQDVINLINTTRIGANYLTYKRLTAPNFKEKMAIVEH